MVTPMTEQPGPGEPSDRHESDRSSSDRSSSDRSSSDRSSSDRSSSDRSSSDRARQSAPGADMLSDLQRWLIRSSARSMRKEISGQVRRTLGGGQRAGSAEVWDTATNEIPPEVGESPECQWCPICRAARRMRESGPGIGGQLSGAGDAVASAVQDAISALDSVLGKAGGSRSGEPRAGDRRPGFREPGEAAAHEGNAAPEQAAAHEHHEAAPAPRGSAAGDHGPGGWKPGDRLATAETAEPDAWAAATDADDSAASGGQPGAEMAGPAAPEHDSQQDGQGHEPDDRG
jgi:hypothetical protein